MGATFLSGSNLNLLVALDALLAEGNVARAAERLGLSASAMSRALARLREETGDPLLVRAGRGLVPTPRAIELRDRVSSLVAEAGEVLRPVGIVDPARLDRRFTIRTSEGFVENFGAALLNRIAVEAPEVRLRFLQKTDKDTALLRDGSVDLETGVLGAGAGPEVRVKRLFRDRFIGAVLPGHDLLVAPVTAARYAAARHVAIYRKGIESGPVDTALAAAGLERDPVTIVSGFATALSLARSAGLVATVPERHTANLRDGLQEFELPVSVPEITVSMFWHPRMENDAGHRWLRGVMTEICGI
jgi:DNA-binding transcriptional LysR family regulator